MPAETDSAFELDPCNRHSPRAIYVVPAARGDNRPVRRRLVAAADSKHKGTLATLELVSTASYSGRALLHGIAPIFLRSRAKLPSMYPVSVVPRGMLASCPRTRSAKGATGKARRPVAAM